MPGKTKPAFRSYISTSTKLFFLIGGASGGTMGLIYGPLLSILYFVGFSAPMFSLPLLLIAGPLIGALLGISAGALLAAPIGALNGCAIGAYYAFCDTKLYKNIKTSWTARFGKKNKYTSLPETSAIDKEKPVLTSSYRSITQSNPNRDIPLSTVIKDKNTNDQSIYPALPFDLNNGKTDLVERQSSYQP